jgi:hypothetical protein
MVVADFSLQPPEKCPCYYRGINDPQPEETER